MEVEWRIDELEKQGQDQAIELNDLKNTIMGPPPNRDNGLRGELRKINIKIDNHIKFRKEECYGLVAVEELEVKIMDKIKDGRELSLAKLNLKGVYAIGMLQFIGMVIVALIAAGVFK